METTAAARSVLSIDFEDDGDLCFLLTSDQILQERRQILETRSNDHQDLQQAQRLSLFKNDSVPVEQLVPGNDIHVRLASAVLTRKSPVIKMFLKQGSLHGNLLKDHGFVEFIDQDISPEALVHILNFFYDHYERVPGYNSSIPGPTFEHIVEALVIIDKWDLHKATFLLKAQWWQALQSHIPISVEDYMARQKQGMECDLRACMSAVHVMGKRAELETLLRIYKLCSTGFPEDDYDLPLPECLHMAERQRLDAIASVNKMLLEYHESARQWLPQALCRCLSLPVARECDRQTLDHLVKAFRRNQWGTSTKRNAGKDGQQAIQLNPHKVPFQEVRGRFPKIKNWPHHCLLEANKAMEKRLLVQQADQMQKQQELLAKEQMASRRRQQLPSNGEASHHKPEAHGAPRIGPSNPYTRARLNLQRQVRARALPAPQITPQPAFMTVPPQGPSHPWPMSTFTFQVRPTPVQQQARLVAGLPPTNTLYTPRQAQQAPPHAIHHGPHQQQQHTGPLSAPPLQASFGTPVPANTQATHLSASSIQTIPGPFDSFDGVDFGLFSDFELFGLGLFGASVVQGTGHSPDSPLDVEAYRSKTAEQNEGPPINACNPSPYHRIMEKITEIEQELLRPVPPYEPPIIVDDEE